MSTPSPVTGFVLAGGKSQRMRREKALISWHGRTLLDHMIELLTSVCDEVRVAGSPDLPDTTPDLGPLGGIRTALHSTATVTNLIVAVDLPLLTKDFLKHFKEHSIRSAKPLVVCSIESGFPLLLGIRRELLDPLDRYIASGRRSLHGFIDATDHETIEGADERLFTNINTEADYQAALEAYKP